MGEIRSFAQTIMSLNIIEQIIQKSGSLIAFYFIANFLPITDVALYGIAISYMVFVSLVTINPESIILRDYYKIKNKTNLFLNTVVYYLIYKIKILFPILVIFSITLIWITQNTNIGIFFFLYASVTILNQFQIAIKDLLYFNKKNISGLWINIMYTISIFIAGASIFYYKSLVIFGILFFILNVFTTVITYLIIKKEFKTYKRDINQEVKEYAKKIFHSFGIWLHFNSNITGTIYKIDPFLLFFFVSQSIVGFYSIALIIVNYFMIWPMLMQKTLQMTLGNIKEKKRNDDVLKKALKYTFLWSIGQYVFFLIFGEVIVEFFAKEQTSYVLLLSLIILTGITILNILRPLLSYVQRFVEQNTLFKILFLPFLISSLGIYLILIYYFGALGAAIGNIISYLIFGLLLIKTKKDIDNQKIPLILIE